MPFQHLSAFRSAFISIYQFLSASISKRLKICQLRQILPLLLHRLSDRRASGRSLLFRSARSIRNLRLAMLMIQNSLPRTWFMGHGCKQVPPELIGGKILWAHPDGYFLNALGNKLEHALSPSQYTNKSNHGHAVPTMRHFGSKSCHSLMCIAFHGPRPAGYECDHLNGVITDYRPSNLQWVPPAENRRRAKILRAMRAAGLDPSTYSRDELLAIFGKYDVGDPHAVMLHDMTHHMEC